MLTFHENLIKNSIEQTVQKMKIQMKIQTRKVHASLTSIPILTPRLFDRTFKSINLRTDQKLAKIFIPRL